MRNYFIDLFEYNGWANTECINSIIAAPSIDEKAIVLISHVIASQKIWLSRINNQGDYPVQPWKVFPSSELLFFSGDSIKEWEKFLKSITDEKLSQNITYKNSRGEQFTNSIISILTHVINHSTYHRGQIAALVRANGGTPAVTDYIFYKRNNPFLSNPKEKT